MGGMSTILSTILLSEGPQFLASNSVKGNGSIPPNFTSSFSIAGCNFSLPQVFGYVTHGAAGTKVGTRNIHRSLEQQKKLMQVMATPLCITNMPTVMPTARSSISCRCPFSMSWPAEPPLLLPSRSSSAATEALAPSKSSVRWAKSQWDQQLRGHQGGPV